MNREDVRPGDKLVMTSRGVQTLGGKSERYRVDTDVIVTAVDPEGRVTVREDSAATVRMWRVSAEYLSPRGSEAVNR